MTDVVKNHPAETAMPVTTAVAALICKLAGVEDTDTILYLAITLSFVPAGVTWVVNLVRNPKVEPNGDETSSAT